MRTAIVEMRGRRADRGEHAGLLLQRYLAEEATGDNGNPTEKRAILDAAAAAARRTASSVLYKNAFNRRSDGLSFRSHRFQLVTEGRLIVGLGSENVLETGITLNHIYGVPIIPGSALKGIASHYCAEVWGAADARFRPPSEEENKAYRKYLANEGPKPDDNFHRLLFGTTDDSGCIVFHDAWFIPESSDQPLVLDVMTPHHLAWLDGSVTPTDFDSPTPVPFVSVTGAFDFVVSWRGPEFGDETKEQWLVLVEQLLRAALADWGVGGKTTSGYGRLVTDPEAEKRRQEEEAARKEKEEVAAFEASLANDSEPLRKLKQLKRDQNWRNEAGDNNMISALQKFADEHPDPPQDCLDWIRDWLESIPKYKGVWDDPDATKGKNEKPKYRAKAVRDLVKRLNPDQS
ncbi:MAG: hypothetical protein KatS3mg105_5228 [Gemmatales bacterium]|nr:MAG: hypothetical protein KatS3mg105_5228 [Gemmatales bacterium]